MRVTDSVSRVESGVASPAMRGAGAVLRAAREGAGLSVDAVAQQLKLAPRQVKAIEDEDFSQLPGRTFVRGFVRNYARLLRLDTATVLAALPDAAATMETPSLQPPAADMGELPAPESTSLGWTRWAIPAALIAIVAAFALYEFLGPATAPRGEPPAATSDAAPVPTPAPSPATSPAAAPENVGTPLANPVVSNAATDASPTAAADRGAAATAGDTVSAPVLPAADSVSAGAPAAAGSSASPPAVEPAAKGSPAIAKPAVILVFRDYSWTEIRDRNGTVLMSRMNAGGTTQSVSADTPIDLVIGNAADVTLTFRGARVDLAPYTRQNVARLTLR